MVGISVLLVSTAQPATSGQTSIKSYFIQLMIDRRFLVLVRNCVCCFNLPWRAQFLESGASSKNAYNVISSHWAPDRGAMNALSHWGRELRQFFPCCQDRKEHFCRKIFNFWRSVFELWAIQAKNVPLTNHNSKATKMFLIWLRQKCKWHCNEHLFQIWSVSDVWFSR